MLMAINDNRVRVCSVCWSEENIKALLIGSDIRGGHTLGLCPDYMKKLHDLLEKQLNEVKNNG